jgi:hypothetical protein
LNIAAPSPYRSIGSEITLRTIVNGPVSAGAKAIPMRHRFTVLPRTVTFAFPPSTWIPSSPQSLMALFSIVESLLNDPQLTSSGSPPIPSYPPMIVLFAM